MTKIYLGKLVSTHGIKGELKLLSDFEYKNKALKKGMPFYINDQVYNLTSSRVHKQYDLILLDDYQNINDVLFLVGNNVYIEREDLNLENDEYLLSDLMDAKVIEDNEELGIITEVLLGGRNNLIRVKTCDGEFLIPLIDEYIKEFNLEEHVLYTKNAKNLKI